MTTRQRRKLCTAFSLSLALSFVSKASSQDVVRTNHIPSGGDEEILGDLWTFACPKGATASISAGTRDDNGNGTSNLDLEFKLLDGVGNLLADGDEQVSCRYDSVCGFDCPAVVDVPCGRGKIHAIAVYSHPSTPSNSRTGKLCNGGGAYDLSVRVTLRNGRVLPEKAVKLGGGPKRRIPRWASGIGNQGPALDDEGLPEFVFRATVSDVSPSTSKDVARADGPEK